MFFRNPDFSLKPAQICVPLTAHKLSELLFMVDNAVKEQANLLEWRVDAFENIPSKKALAEILKTVREHGKGTPILATWRSHRDGGKYIEDRSYGQLYKWLLEIGLVEIVDLELSMKPELLEELISLAGEYNVETLLSHHDFKGTPTKEELISLLKRMVAAGGSAVKFAVTPNSVEDVVTTMETVVEFKKNQPEVPIVGISMGKLGSVTRAWGSVLGTALIFATVDKSSAPGQLSVSDIRYLRNIL